MAANDGIHVVTSVRARKSDGQARLPHHARTDREGIGAHVAGQNAQTGRCARPLHSPVGDAILRLAP